MKLTIYARPECHLCHEAIDEAGRLRDEHERAFEIEIVDIERDDGLLRRYLEAIPVIEIDGVEVLRIDGHRRGGLRRAIESARAGA